MAPIVNHCGIVSINILPISAIILDDVGLSSSIPYISALCNEGAALITFGVAALPSVVDCKSRSVERRRGCGEGIEVDEVLLLSAFCFLAMLAAEVLLKRVVECRRNRSSKPQRHACTYSWKMPAPLQAQLYMQRARSGCKRSACLNQIRFHVDCSQAVFMIQLMLLVRPILSWECGP
jgi:hypothetical protein